MNSTVGSTREDKSCRVCRLRTRRCFLLGYGPVARCHGGDTRRPRSKACRLLAFMLKILVNAFARAKGRKVYTANSGYLTPNIPSAAGLQYPVRQYRVVSAPSPASAQTKRRLAYDPG